VSGVPVANADFKSYPVRFGVVEIARNDPDEELLVQTLLESEPDLARSDEPMAFPVFGRGRALYALVGAGIGEKNIREACQALLAWCSCDIKAQNPGTDLLISADWSRPFGGQMVKDPEVPLTGVSAFLEKRPQAKPAPPPPAASAPALCKLPARPAAAAPAPPATSPLLRNLLYLGGAAGVLLLACSLILNAKTKRKS
jgi:hypothetical protein